MDRPLELAPDIVGKLLAWQAVHWQPTEWMVHHLYRTLLRPGDWAVDGGAHTGLHSEGMARFVGDGQVFAFEPNREVLPVLRANLKDSELTNIRLFEVALADRVSTAVFYSHMEHSPLSGLAIANGRSADEYTTSQVLVVTIDAALGPDDHRVRFIKLDLEGHELPALHGAWSVLRRARPYVAFEYGNPSGPSADDGDIFGFFRGLGYDLFDPFFRPYGPAYFAENQDRARGFPLNFIAAPIERRGELSACAQRMEGELGSIAVEKMNQAAATNFRTPAL